MAQEVAQIVFIRESKVLLGFRQNTDVLDQMWGFPSGRVESGELPLFSAVRESLEEVAVEPVDLDFLTDLYDTQLGVRHYFYVCEKWKGEIVNAEPYLCRELHWFDLKRLPEN